MGFTKMSPDIILYFEGGYLRPLKLADVHADYISGLNDVEINRYLEVRHIKQTTQTVLDFVAAELQSTNSVLWGIWEENAEKHCGTIRLHGIEFNHKTAHIGICLFNKMTWGRRIASKAIVAATQWAIGSLGLRWVEAGAYAENIRSQRAFISAGYSWVFDIPEKFLFEGNSTVVKVFVARRNRRLEK
jgi:ribosomal-protein-alanine N-acetyltransferase